VISLALLLWSAQAAPLSADGAREQDLPPISAISWRCTASPADGQAPIELNGSFPAMSVAGQKSDVAFRVTTNVGSSDRRFAGAYQTVLASGVPMLTNYTITIPRPNGRYAYVLRLQFLPLAGNGTVKIVQFDKSGDPITYATGLCTTQAAK
jgi:hypothetical protein